MGKSQRFDLDNMSQSELEALMRKRKSERKEHRLARVRQLREEEDAILAASANQTPSSNGGTSNDMDVDGESQETAKSRDSALAGIKRPKPSPSAKAEHQPCK